MKYEITEEQLEKLEAGLSVARVASGGLKIHPANNSNAALTQLYTRWEKEAEDATLALHEILTQAYSLGEQK